MTRTLIPFGPQHPVLPEPLHLTLDVSNEVVTAAVPVFGFVHRGLERLVERRDFRQMIQVVERVCGICSTMHALCYCQCLEELMAIAIPPRARYLRVVWAELHRIQSHLLWLGLFADSFGFESLFMQCWRIRERMLDLNQATAGNRIIPAVNVIGGVARDLGGKAQGQILTTLEALERDTGRLAGTLFEDATVRQRTSGKGRLTGPEAYELGAVGPTLRASGVAQDVRQLGYAAYGELEFAPVVESDGDCLARTRVRYREIAQSIALVRTALERLPAGEIAVPPGARKPHGEAIGRVEQPRGELLYYVRADGSAHLTRLRMRTPTFANAPTLGAMLPGVELADVPVILLSIDPCVSCTER
jgi:ech hydrogenase subunit E